MNQLSPVVLSGHTSQGKAADQKFCHSCGVVLHHSAAHCTACGAVQAGVPIAPFLAPQVQPGAGGAAFAPGNLPPHHVYCRGCGAGIHETAQTCPKCGAPQRLGGGSATLSGRSRTTAALLAFFLGGLGAHKFYLGSIWVGLFYMIFVWTFIPSFVALIEGIYYLTMSDEEFARKY